MDDSGGERHEQSTPTRREALWLARRALVANPGGVSAAFPGVERRSAENAERRRPHPFRAEAHNLRGLAFAYEGKRWSAEAVTVIDAAGTVGLYAYDTTAHASATLRLEVEP